MTWQFAQVPSAHSTSNYKIVAGSDVSEFCSSGFFIELFLCSADEYWRRSEFVGAFFAMRNREFLQQGGASRAEGRRFINSSVRLDARHQTGVRRAVAMKRSVNRETLP
jgi:hypothetical protein